MSKKGGAGLPNDVPWRASSAAKPIPKINHSPFLRIPHTSYSNYALSLMKHEYPIGSGLGKEAVVEAGQTALCLDKLHPSSYLVLRYGRT